MYSASFRYIPVPFLFILSHSRVIPPCSGIFLFIPLYTALFVCHSASFRCHSASFRHIPVYSGIFRSVPVFSNTRHADHFQVPSQLLYSIRPVPNVVLLPCRTQMNLAWQWHDDGTAAVSNVEPNTVAPNSKDKTNHPPSVIVCK